MKLCSFETLSNGRTADKPKALCPFNFFNVGGIKSIDLANGIGR